MSAYPTCAHFAEQVGTIFSAVVDGREVAFELALASEGIGSGTYEQFSLEFTGPSDPTLPQATYALAHAVFGTLDVFLTPIGPGRYQAAFNVAKESDE
jgi:hypothetical protein